MRGSSVAIVLAVAVVALAMPSQIFAGESASYTTPVKPAKERAPKDKITTTCVPGTDDYNIDQCYKDIKGK
jgi:hypothetical protein